MGCRDCRRMHSRDRSARGRRESGIPAVALVGNPNVGKSVLFNQLTGAHQIIGNWPGKTVQVFKGRLRFRDREIELVDLPGTYSISSDIGEERSVRRYILEEKPDLVICVVDSNFLERNLALVMELTTLDVPVVVALNQIDRAERHGILIDDEQLEKELGVPVVPISGLLGIGITDLLQVSLEIIGSSRRGEREVFHTPHISRTIRNVRNAVGEALEEFPGNWAAERLLAGDEELERLLEARRPNALRSIRAYRNQLQIEMEDDISSILAADRFASAAALASKVVKHSGAPEIALEERIHGLLTHRVYGILLLVMIAGSSFFALFTIGEFFATMLTDQFERWHAPFVALFSDAAFGEFIWNGLLGGVLSVLSIVLPYLIPFFILLAILEDTGYIARVAFVMDSLLHRVGLHGKAFIPMLLGYSCSVPACMGCRIVETEKERVLAIFAVTLIPCAATSIVILGLVGTYVGIYWVIGIYGFNLLIVATLTRLAYGVLPGDPTGLIMEMPPLRRPSLKTLLRQSWVRAKDFLYIAVPLLIVVGLLLGALDYAGMLDPIEGAMAPVTVTWLGLPLFAGTLLIFGILRKELTLVLLGSVAGTLDFASVMTDVQMIVFTLVVVLYIPCIATIAALIREIGAKRSVIITAFEIGFALLVAGIAFRVLSLFM